MSSVVYQLPFPVEATPANGEFGNRAAFRANPHRGHDFSQFHLTRLGLSNVVTAIADGVVELVIDNHAVFGILVVIRHADGVRSSYAHMSERSVWGGQQVSRGQGIGRVGATGQVTGAHLHLNVGPNRDSYWIGECWDPIRFIQERSGGGGVAQPIVTALEDMQLIAAYLNSRNVNQDWHTNVDDGVRGRAYYWGVQHFGNVDGVYPIPPYKDDGEPGPKTYEVEAHHMLPAARAWWAAQQAAVGTPEPVEPVVPDVQVAGDLEALLERFSVRVRDEVLAGIRDMTFGAR